MSNGKALTSGITSGALITTPGLIIGEIRAFAFGDSTGIAALEKQGWLPCEGQSLSLDPSPAGFPELEKALHTTWGSLDTAHVFNVPDLRGMFLRGWNHGPIPTNDPAGDPDVGGRTPPRPDMSASGGVPGNDKNAVGSYQPGSFESHSHGGLVAGPESGEKALLFPNEGAQSAYRWQTNQSGPGWWARLVGSAFPPSGGTGSETRSKNVYVLYAIFTGRQVVP
jgi:hypothetical protein